MFCLKLRDTTAVWGSNYDWYPHGSHGRVFLVVSPQFCMISSLRGLSICICRHIFQLHHDDGGQQCGPHGGRPQLSPQDGGDPRHASLGPQCLPPVAALATQDEQTEEKNISQNNNDEQ